MRKEREGVWRDESFFRSGLREEISKILYKNGASKETLTEVIRRISLEIAVNSLFNLPPLKKQQRESLSQALAAISGYKPNVERGDDIDLYNELLLHLTAAVSGMN